MTTTGAARGRGLAALVLWLSSGLALGRFLLLFGLDHVLRGLPLDSTLWRMAQHAWLPVVHALGAAACAVALCAWRARDERAPQARRARDVLALLAAGALIASALAGWPIDDPIHTPRWSTDRGRLAILGMAVLGIAAAFLLIRLARAVRAGTRIGRAVSARAAVLAGAAFLVLPPLVLAFGHGRLAARSTVREVVREIGLEPSSWRETGRHPRLGPATRVLCPVPDWRFDGGDLPGLLMPPPCVVEFEILTEDGPVFLRGAAGIDHQGYDRASPRDATITVRFEVRVNGRVAFEQDAEVAAEQDPEEREWRRFGGERGLPLAPGDRVQLSTLVVDPIYESAVQVPVLPAGFGGLVLERELVKERAPASPDAPNIVLIVMDTLRQDRLSCYGYERETTPKLDLLAARGTLFENAYATSSWTWPSTASILTGLPPESHGVEADEACYLRSEIDSLPKLLARRGYTTAAFSCNPLIVPNKGFARGFEDFDSLHGFRRSDGMIHLPLEWIEMHAGARFFLYLHLVDTHAPYVPLPVLEEEIEGARPADFPEGGVNDYHPRLLHGEGRDEGGKPVPEGVVPASHLHWMTLLYDASVTTADHFVGQVLERLEELGLADRTVVAFTSDHGEEFLDHGLVTHGNTLHRELVRVPLILAGPGIQAGRRVSTSVSTRHLAPTLAKFGNARFRDLPDPLDLSLAGEIEAQPIFFSTHQGWWNGRHRLVISGVKSGEWELHSAPAGAPWGAEPGGEPPGEMRLYHLAEDPQQLRDVSREFPDKAAELKELLDRHLEESRRARELPVLGTGSQSRELLEKIGYTEGDG